MNTFAKWKEGSEFVAPAERPITGKCKGDVNLQETRGF